MSELKATPGPYTLQEFDQGWILVDGNGDGFETIYKRGDQPAGETAYLLAASWELYHALEKALPQMAHKPECIRINPAFEWGRMGSINADSCQCAIQEVNAALAKARGKQ